MNSTPSLSAEITTFEEFVAAKSHTPALRKLLDILVLIEGGIQGFGKQRKEMSETAEREATRLCSAITTFIVDKSLKLNRGSFSALARHKRALTQAFEVSGYRGTNHFLDLFGTRAEGGNRSLESFETPKLLTVLSVNEMKPELVRLFMKQKPEITFLLLLGFLSEQLTYSEVGEKFKAHLFDLAENWASTKLAWDDLRNIGPAYMGCSYAEAANKHDIKKTFNALVEKVLAEKGVESIPARQRNIKTGGKPVVAVIGELYNSKHAMHRCYGPSLLSLKDRFHTVLFTPDGGIDEALKGHFSEIDDTPYEYENPKRFIDRVKAYGPDIVYFPSIGMRHCSIITSNVRMAPIQLMTFGHPATTHSPYIDYAILGDRQVGDDHVGDPRTVKEKILCHVSEPRFVMRDDADFSMANIRENPNTVRIAVPAWSRKITSSFLAACGEIQQKAKKPVEFWFFPNAGGVLFQACSRRYSQGLNAKVFPRDSYLDYINNLSACDLFLSSFPFGATNGLVDAACLGLPIVNLAGPEMHASNDGDIVSYIDMPEWLTTKSIEEYIEATLKLVDNDELRVAISKQVLDCDPASRLLLNDDERFDSFADAVEAAYLFHEDIQASEQQVYRSGEIVDMLQNKKV